MRKNGSRLISLRQYRLTDLFIFAAILVVFDLLAYYAPKFMPNSAVFTFMLTVPMVVLVMIRWGWPSVFFAIGDGIAISLMYNANSWQSYVSFVCGNSCIMLLLIVIKFIGKQKITEKWYFSVLFVVSAWILSNLGTSCVQAICGYDFLTCLGGNFGISVNGLMSLAIGVVLILILRKLDGMFEDQKHYLLRLDAERKEMMRRDTFGDVPIEIDEESLSILRKTDDELQ